MALSSKIQALIDYANETTGAGDTRLGDAVKTLCDGYGGGGGGGKIEFEVTFPTKVISADISYSVPSTPKRATIYKDFTPQSDNEVVFASAVRLPWEGILNVNGTPTPVDVMQMTLENRTAQAYLYNGASAVIEANEPKVDGWKIQVRNASYGLIGTYKVIIEY